MRKFAQYAKIRPIYENSPNMRKFAQYAKISPICANSPNLRKFAQYTKNRPICANSPNMRKFAQSGHTASRTVEFLQRSNILSFVCLPFPLTDLRNVTFHNRSQWPGFETSYGVENTYVLCMDKFSSLNNGKVLIKNIKENGWNLKTLKAQKTYVYPCTYVFSHTH
jgi:hypothetical protein